MHFCQNCFSCEAKTPAEKAPAGEEEEVKTQEVSKDDEIDSSNVICVWLFARANVNGARDTGEPNHPLLRLINN